MNKKTIITALLVNVALTGQGQVYYKMGIPISQERFTLTIIHQ